MSASVAVVQSILFEARRCGHVRFATPILQLLDDLALFARLEQIRARAIERNAPLGDDLNLGYDRAIEKREMRVVQAKLFRAQFAMRDAQTVGTLTEIVVQTPQFRFCLIERPPALRDDLLLLVLDALALVEYRLQAEDELLHATLISCAIVFS
jgi:hypothetical protein